MANKRKGGKVVPMHTQPKAVEQPEQSEPTPEQTIEFLRNQLNDAYLVIGQKEMQIQRQQVIISQLGQQIQELQENTTGEETPA